VREKKATGPRTVEDQNPCGLVTSFQQQGLPVDQVHQEHAHTDACGIASSRESPAQWPFHKWEEACLAMNFEENGLPKHRCHYPAIAWCCVSTLVGGNLRVKTPSNYSTNCSRTVQSGISLGPLPDASPAVRSLIYSLTKIKTTKRYAFTKAESKAMPITGHDNPMCFL
jgi:hypothetical protein